MVAIAADLFAQRGIAPRPCARSPTPLGSCRQPDHHFDSKESIGDEILSGFINEVLANYRAAVAEAADPRAVLEQIVRSTNHTLSSHRAALTMLQNDWNHFAAQPRFAYLPRRCARSSGSGSRKLRTRPAGLLRADLDPKLPIGCSRTCWPIPRRSGAGPGGYSGDQVANGFLRILFGGIAAAPGAAPA